jgi:hypothetical protein
MAVAAKWVLIAKLHEHPSFLGGKAARQNLLLDPAFRLGLHAGLRLFGPAPLNSVTSVPTAPEFRNSLESPRRISKARKFTARLKRPRKKVKQSRSLGAEAPRDDKCRGFSGTAEERLRKRSGKQIPRGLPSSVSQPVSPLRGSGTFPTDPGLTPRAHCKVAAMRLIPQ